MNIAPLTETNPWYGRILADERIQTDSLVGVPVETTVEVELVELLHGGPEDNFRPYLHLRGELTAAQPAVALPYGVSDLTLRRGSGVPMDAFYDFTHPQLADLVSKGYFSSAFRVPEEMSNIPWTLPAKANFLVVAPELADEPPVVFMSIHQQTGLELDEANSGYELSAYFPDYTTEAQATHESDQASTETGIAPQHAVSAFDAFAATDLEVNAPAAFAPAVPESSFDAARAAVPDGVFSRLVKEIQAQQPDPQPVVETEVEAAPGIVPGSAEDVYLSRVSPGVDHVLAGDHLVIESESADTEAASEQQAEIAQTETEQSAEAETAESPAETAVPTGFINFGEPDEELEPLNLQFGGATEDEHRRAVERRQARLRAEVEAIGEKNASDEAQPGL